MYEKPLFQQFVCAMMNFMDERARPPEERSMIGRDEPLLDHWYNHAEKLFHQAIEEAVIKQLESVELDVVVNKPARGE